MIAGTEPEPTLKGMIGDLDNARKVQVSHLKMQRKANKPISKKQQEQIDLAPVSSLIACLTPQGEPFFDTVYPDLVQIGKEHTEQKAKAMATPALHFGIAGTRNLSIMAATRADGAVLCDYNIIQQRFMDAIEEVASKLIRERGVGNFTPRDFVAQFEQHPIQETLATIKEKYDEYPDIRTSLAEELIVPESWLYDKQDDGRFDHIMQLYEQGRIGTIAMNLIDKQGFNALGETLEEVRAQIPELENAEVKTVFLSNLISHLNAKNAYFLRDSELAGKDNTPRDSTEYAWRNLERIATNPYVVMAHETVKGIMKQPDNPFWEHPDITTPLQSAIKQALEEKSTSYKGSLQAIDDERMVDYLAEPIVYYLEPENSQQPRHHYDWKPINQIIMGGKMEAMREALQAKNPPSFTKYAFSDQQQAIQR